MFIYLLSCQNLFPKTTDCAGVDCCQLTPEQRFLDCDADAINMCSENPCFAERPEIQIGSGEYQWEDLDEYDPVMMVHGPQGGWHMLGSISLHNSNQVVEVSFQIFTSDDIMISDNNYRVAMIMEDECEGYYPGMFGYLNVTAMEDGERDTPPELLENTQVRFEFSTNDCSQKMNDRNECSREGRWAHSTLIVSTQLDPQDITTEE